LSPEFAAFIRRAAHQVFGDDVVVRNYGTDPSALRLHIETTSEDRLAAYDFVGVLMTRVDHTPHVEITRRGEKPRGSAKIAYRQGRVI
jgi:hypothetical protein